MAARTGTPPSAFEPAGRVFTHPGRARRVDGKSIEVSTSADRLDAIVDAIDDLLSEPKASAFGVEGETYQMPLGQSQLTSRRG
ncbi:MAG TPA: hypothetical protein VMQ62_09170 [Dongiaceae bacterium]|nr:hypothetical protein [Dongiaceae bacterium]